MDEDCIIKERFVKKYRHPDLDKKLTKNRIINEAKNMERSAKEGINVPTIYFVDLQERKIYMEAIPNCCPLKDILKIIDENQLNNKESDYKCLIDKICEDIGKLLSKLHSANIIHGDLTTSNLLLKLKNENKNFSPVLAKENILKEKNYDSMYLIDFGLSCYAKSSKGGIEDKGVDLYVLKRAIVSSNKKSEEMFEKILEIYKQNCIDGPNIIEHYRKVEMRGRKRIAFG